MKHRLVTFILDAHKDILQRIEQVIDYISVTIEALRVGRSAPRALKSFRDNYLPPERTDQLTSDWRISLSPTAD
jgi:hypothetical protein